MVRVGCAVAVVGSGLAVPAARALPEAYVANRDDDSLSVIDTASNVVTATIWVGLQPVDVTVSGDGKWVYVGGREVAVVDTTTRTVLRIIPRHAFDGIAASPDGTRIFVANPSCGLLDVIRSPDGDIVASVRVGDGPVGVAVHPDGAYVYVGNARTDRERQPCNFAPLLFCDLQVVMIDTGTNRMVNSVTIGDDPAALAVSKDGTRLYVVSNRRVVFTDGDPWFGFRAVVSMFDSAMTEEFAVVPFRLGPRGTGGRVGLAVHPDGRHVYVDDSEGIAVLDMVGKTVERRVQLGLTALRRDIALNEEGTRAYVTNEADDTVSVIDTTTDTVVATIPVGRHPEGIAMGPEGPTRTALPSEPPTVTPSSTPATSATPIPTQPPTPTYTPVPSHTASAHHSPTATAVLPTTTPRATTNTPAGNGSGCAIGPVPHPDGGPAMRTVALLFMPLVAIWAVVSRRKAVRPGGRPCKCRSATGRAAADFIE